MVDLENDLRQAVRMVWFKAILFVENDEDFDYYSNNKYKESKKICSKTPFLCPLGNMPRRIPH